MCTPAMPVSPCRPGRGLDDPDCLLHPTTRCSLYPYPVKIQRKGQCTESMESKITCILLLKMDVLIPKKAGLSMESNSHLRLLAH